MSVVIPTYNEAATIGTTLLRVDAELADAEVLVVDDDSDDETATEAARTGQGMDSLVQVRVRSERGLASAICDGLRWARGDVAVVLDADGQHPPSRIPDLVGEIRDDAVVAVGSRWTDDGGVPDRWPGSRRWLSRVGGRAAGVVVPGARLTSDPMSGFFAVDRGSLEPLLRDLDPGGWKALLAILRWPVLGPDDVVDVGYKFRPRLQGESKLSPRAAAANAIEFASLALADGRAGR